MDSGKSTATLKFLCSYGGKILPRHTDAKLRYVGGLTRVLAVDRSVSFAELTTKIGEFCGSSVALKCQLPDGDLDTLISITSDEDLANVIEEYDRASISLSHPLKIRAILSPPTSHKQISPPSSSTPSVKAVDSHPNSPTQGLVDGTSSPPPPCRFVNRIPSPPIRYQFGSRNCSRRTCFNPCHFAGNQRMLYPGPHSINWN